MRNGDTNPAPRRRFFGQLLGGVAAWAGLPAIADAADAAEDQTADTRQHDAWMREIGGRHRQIFHAATHSEMPLIMAANYLDVYGSAFGVRPGQARAIIGVHGSALGIGLQSSLWEKYELGRMNNITDPTTREPAKRNVSLNDSSIGINTLMERGVTLLVCNMALTRLANSLASTRSLSATDLHAELRAGVLRGSVIVPALVVALNRAQEKGFTYVRAS